MWYIYFNGEMYYPSLEAHYKHGKVVDVCFDENEARQLAIQMNVEKKLDDEIKQVIELMQNDYGKGVADWNVTDNEVVELLDSRDNVIQTISLQQLGNLYDRLGWS